MPSTHRLQFLKKHNLPSDTSLSLSEISKLSGVPITGLQEVYNRGIGAWKSNPESVRLTTGEKNYKASRAGKMGKEQWAFARIFSFVNKGKTFYTTDSDIARKYKLM